MELRCEYSSIRIERIESVTVRGDPTKKKRVYDLSAKLAEPLLNNILKAKTNSFD